MDNGKILKASKGWKGNSKEEIEKSNREFREKEIKFQAELNRRITKQKFDTMCHFMNRL